MWPSFADISKDDCRQALRTLELETYGGMINVLRAQGHFNADKKKLLSDVAAALSIPLERHKAEVRRAVNDEKLNAIADVLVGPNTGNEWAIEGRRMIPLLPRPQHNTVFSVIADECADYVSTNREVRASEGAHRPAEFPFPMEPASPEPSRTQNQLASPSGVLVFPSGTAIQMKREVEDEDGERKRRRAPPHMEPGQISPSSPPPKGGISMSSRTMSAAFSSGATPLKIALPTSGSRTPTSSVQNFTSTPKQVIIVSNSGSPNTPSILQKTLSVPMKANQGKPTVMYTQGPGGNTPEAFKQRPKTMQSTPQPKPRPNTIVVSQKAPLKALTPGKHGMPMQTKIVMQPKGVGRGAPKPQQVVLQQKPGKQTMVANVQVKTAQGFTNVPVQLRAGTKPVQIKQDGQMKMVSITGGAKILPKPTQSMFVVTSNSTPLTMVTRTVPAGCPPRVMTVPTGAQAVKWNQGGGAGAAGQKAVQTMVAQQARRQESVVLVQKAPAKTIVPHTVKESPIGKVHPKTVQRPVTSISTSLAQSLQQITTNSQAQLSQPAANLILFDLTNQEKVSGNVGFAEILQASNIVEEEKSISEERDAAGKEEKEVVVKEEAVPITSLSIEEAVEMLNRSDTPETRALLSQAGIQISDEIADSEEEEQQLVEKSPQPDQQPQTVIKVDVRTEEPEAGEILGVSPEPITQSIQQTSQASPSLPSAVHTLSTRSRSLDIFSTALASANINLDSFMEEEDEPEVDTSAKDDAKEESKEDEATDSAADSSTDL